MQIKEVTIHAARTFNHPYETYSKCRPGVSITAQIADGEDAEKAIKTLQAKAEKLVEDQKQHLLQAYKDEYELEQSERRIASLEANITEAQDSLDKARARQMEITQRRPLLPAGE